MRLQESRIFPSTRFQGNIGFPFLVKEDIGVTSLWCRWGKSPVSLSPIRSSSVSLRESETKEKRGMPREVGSDGFSTCRILTEMVQLAGYKFNWKVCPDSSKLIPSALAVAIRAGQIRHLCDSNNLAAFLMPILLSAQLLHVQYRKRDGCLILSCVKRVEWKETRPETYRSFYADKMPHRRQDTPPFGQRVWWFSPGCVSCLLRHVNSYLLILGSISTVPCSRPI